MGLCYFQYFGSGPVYLFICFVFHSIFLCCLFFVSILFELRYIVFGSDSVLQIILIDTDINLSENVTLCTQALV